MKPYAKATSSGVSVGRRGLGGLALVSFVVFVLVGVLPLVSARASGAFKIEGQPQKEKVFATRVALQAEVVDGAPEFEWHSEYATSENGPWTASASGIEDGAEAGSNVAYISLGTADEPVGLDVLHKLSPNTAYYARFHAKKGSETVERTFSFTTTGVTQPEVAEDLGDGASTFRAEATGPRSAVAKAQIESNGAATKYAFEYAPAEANGQAPGEHSAAWSAFEPAREITVAEDFAIAEARVTDLVPETRYYTRVSMTNEVGTKVQLPEVSNVNPGWFRTPTGRPVVGEPEVRNVTGTSAHITGSINPHGLETKWHFEYAAAAEGPWKTVSGAEGVVSAAQAQALPEGAGAPGVEGALSGLAPSKEYFVRLFAESSAGEGRNYSEEPIVSEKREFASFTTFGAPSAVTLAVHGLHGEALRVMGGVDPDSVPTSGEQTIAVEGAPTGGTFTLTFDGDTTGGTGTADLEAGSSKIEPFVVTTGEFAVGEVISGAGIPAGTTITGLLTPQEVLEYEEDALKEHVREVQVRKPYVKLSEPITATATGAVLRANISYDSPSEVVGHALEALPTIGRYSSLRVSGPDGGPYTVYFGTDGGLREKAEPQIVAGSSGLTPSGTVTVATVFAGGEGYDTHYHFEYVSQKQFEAPGSEGGFAKADSTQEVDLGVGDSTEYVGVDLPALVAGETYRFRTVATSTSPGDPVVYGEEQALTVSAASSSSTGSEGSGGCPNEGLRTGFSALLPDCRAYEQLTPVDKEGAQEIFNYGGKFGAEGAQVGEDGDHLELGVDTVKWGAGPRAGQSPYFFSRTSTGWQITAASAQPGAGVYHYNPEVFSSNLSGFAFEKTWGTSTKSESPRVEFMAGPAGGPYTMVASVARAEAPPGWAGGSSDLSTLVLQDSDHTLLGHSTHTVQGDDLYEYSNGGLRQLNVTGGSPGATIGSCGANIAVASEAEVSTLTGSNVTVGQYAISEDGSSIFVEAVPGNNCSEAKHLYVRVNGSRESAQTVDIGAYTFVAASPDGSHALIEKAAGENPGLYLYSAESQSARFLSGSGVAAGANLNVSEDLSTVYIRNPGRYSKTPDLYRYNVATEKLSFITHLTLGDEQAFNTSPEGRYLYFMAQTVAGLPGGGVEAEAPHTTENQSSQVYRYDSAEQVIQCMSCASPYDPEPKLSALFVGSGDRFASDNGDFVFFDTPAALLPSDVDGEDPAEDHPIVGVEHSSNSYSLSSDVYEWRRDGIDGCSHVRGCLSLITAGRGGFANILLGTSRSGDDVFFETKETLVAQDAVEDGTSENIYDARVDGGFPEPARPVECKGDSCSTPFAPPGEVTPASATFQGAGNPIPAATPPPKAKTRLKKKVVKKKPKKKKSSKRSVKSNRRGK